MSPEICQLVNLQDLYLDRNQITLVPSEICKLVNLQNLRLSYNQITSVSLQFYNFANNTITNEIIK